MTKAIKNGLASFLYIFLVLSFVPIISFASDTNKERNMNPKSEFVFDSLSNGLHYYIRKNVNPKGRVELRLVVNAGSVQEDSDQLGFAHLVEHMAFNGTKNFPKHTLIDFVESVGMSFGAHLNAYTNFDETVYTLSLPLDKPENLNKGLQVLQDWAGGGILHDSLEVVAERGVVLGEWRSRLQDTLAMRNFARLRSPAYGEDSDYIHKLPIGDPELLKKANRSAVKRFYDDWYRTDLMAIVVVGDIDVYRIQADIKQRFGNIARHPNPRPRRSAKTKDVTAPVFDVFRGYVTSGLNVYWRDSHNPGNSTEVVRRNLVNNFLIDELRSRYFTLLGSQRRPFVLASASYSRSDRGLGPLYTIGLGAYPDSLVTGLTAALTELARIAKHGIPVSTLQNKKVAYLRQLENVVSHDIVQPSSYLADIYKSHYLTGNGLLLSPEQELNVVREVLPKITQESLKEFATELLNNQERIIQFTIPQFASTRSPTEAEINFIIDSLKKTDILPLTKINDKAVDGKLMDVPKVVGSVTSEVKYPKADVSKWILSNGATVLYKHTNNTPNQLLIQAYSLGGSSLLPDSLFFGSGRLVTSLITAAAGFGDHTREGLKDNEALTSIVRDFKVSLKYGEEEVYLNGSADDAETLFQMMYLTFTSPNIDTAALSAWKQYGVQTIEESPLEDQLALSIGGGVRFAPPSPALVSLFDMDQGMQIFKDRFGDASDFTFIVVGSLLPDKAKEYVQNYIATLPSTNRKIREQPLDPKIKSLADRIYQESNGENLPRANAIYLFDGFLGADSTSYISDRNKLSFVTWITERRLRNELRERLSATYGVGVSGNIYRAPKHHYRVFIQFVADPTAVDSLVRVLDYHLDSLRRYGALQEEIDLANEVVARRWEIQLQNNSYWLAVLQDFDREGISFERIVESPRLKLTPGDVKQAVRKFMPDTAFVRGIFRPTDEVMKSLKTEK